MPTLPDLTIAIITCRPDLLKRCLSSIYDQSYQPKKILTIKGNKLSIPQKRNIALRRCTTKYLAFVDDDCILDNNWTITAYRQIATHPQLAFVVGKTNLFNSHSTVAKLQYQNYLQWFDQTHTLDTKNVIFNTDSIKNFRFDNVFKIFEDVDYDLQLKSKKLFGEYCPKMQLHHPEVSNILSAIKKNYIRGQYKSLITSKWGNFDNYTPTLPHFTRPLSFLLNFAFYLGYSKHRPKLITIVNRHDGGANEQRLHTFHDYLTAHHINVNIIDSHSEFQKVIASRRYLFTYGFPLLKYRIMKWIYGPDKPLVETMILKSLIVHKALVKNHTTLAIIQYPEDMLTSVVSHRTYKTLYDSPTIFYKELELANCWPKSTISIIRKLETKVYLVADHVSFHWYTYFDIAKSYGLKITNPITLNWGCHHQTKLATFKPQSKIIHIGKLNSYWANPSLLSNISQHLPLSIFSYEKPDPHFYPQLKNYKGFMKDEDRIADYQFGLITLSKDDFRSQGFSAKYLHYLSYGLPVLCPMWRYDKLLTSATIFYNEKNIDAQIKKYSQPRLWQKKHLAALKLTDKLNYQNNLKPLLNLLENA